MEYHERSFDLPDLKGISPEQIDAHLGLYSGYVSHVNKSREAIHAIENEQPYAASELRRRFSFEFNGMRLHEYYFAQFEGGPKSADKNGPLASALSEKYGSVDAALEHIVTVAKTRGSGWCVVYWDPVDETPHTVWVDEHHHGILAGAPILIALDMWEHAYMVDYLPSEKGEYIERFFDNLNCDVVEQRLEQAKRGA